MAKTFRIGADVDEDIIIQIDNGDANPPQIKYDSATNQFMLANDGVNFNVISAMPVAPDSVTWENPWRLGPLRMWPDESASPKVIRVKDGSDPSSETDGDQMMVSNPTNVTF